MRRNNFLRGAIVLAIAGVIVKFLGAFFRIPLGNILGDEGMSFYQTPYPIYNWLLVLSTAGIPTAIAKIISEKRAIGDYDNIEKVFRVAFRVLFFTGLISSALMYFGAGLIASFVKNPGAELSIKALSPAIFIVSLMAVYRGYFNGMQSLNSYGISQVIEQLGRVFLGIYLSFVLLDKGLEYAAAGAVMGATVGAFIGLIFIWASYHGFRGKFSYINPQKYEEEDTKYIIKNLIKIALPVTLGASIMPLMSLIDLGLVMRRLTEIGLGQDANNLYGQLSAYAGTLVNIPMVFLAAISISIVPAVASFYAKKDYENLNSTIQNGMKIALIIAIPAGIGLSSLATPILELLYPMQLDIIPSTAKLLNVLGISVILLSIYQTSTGILQGLGAQNTPAKNLLISSIVKFVFAYILIGIPSINVLGAAISSLIAYGLASFLNLLYMKKKYKIKYDYISTFIMPLLSGLVMGVFAYYSYALFSNFLSNSKSTIISILLSAFIYFILLFVTKVINKDNINSIPFLKRFGRYIWR
jgi:stage V sporulation protein B